MTNHNPPPTKSSRPKVVELKPGLDLLRRTDIGNTDLFVKVHGRDLLYSYPRKKWLCWDSKKWSWENGELQADKRAEDVARRLVNDAIKSFPFDSDEIKHGLNTSCVAKRRAMVQGARHHLAVNLESLDANDWLFNVQNGTIDLGTGDIRRHSRKDMITTVSPVRYDPEATCPRWDRFLQEVLVDGEKNTDNEMISFVQRAVGYTLTGKTSEQKLIMFVGPTGQNGKSVFLKVISKLLGDYSCNLPFTALLDDGKSRNTRNKGPELLPLLGARLATAIEPNAGQKMDEAVIKALTGEDEISLNPKYEKVFSFRPKARLWIACNTPPNLSAGGSAMARRLVIVPFHRHFTLDEREENLADKLMGELSGILNWALKGCADWLERGLAAPEAVATAGEEYAAEHDPIKGWLDAYVTPLLGYNEPLSRAYKSYMAYAEAQGFRAPSSRKLADLLRGHGHTVKRSTKGERYVFDVQINLPATSAEENAEG